MHDCKKEKTAILLGATGLVGSSLLTLLLDSSCYKEVIIFVRKSIAFEHKKLIEHIVDFDQPQAWSHLVIGNDLFSAFGTTIKKAGSKEKQYKIDVTYQLDIAESARNNGVENYFLVSAPNANSKSKIFYNQIKGKLEDEIAALKFPNTVIFRPSLLVGNRPEKRKGEIYGAYIMKKLLFLPLVKKYQPIPGAIVATAMLKAANTEIHNSEYSFNEIFDLANSQS